MTSLLSFPVKFDTCPFWNTLDLAELEAAVPTLFSGVAELGTTIRHAALLVLRANTSTLHTDHTVGANRGVLARLNVPVLNCEGSRTAFFKMSKLQEALKRVQPQGTCTWANRELYKPITSVELDRPTILRTSAPHTVYCNTNSFPRVSLTVIFERDAVNWLDTCND